MADNNVVTGSWNYNEDTIERDTNLNLERIQENGTIAQMIETINANFESIARHGGGPAGADGKDGLKGIDGTNVEYIYALCDKMEVNKHYPGSESGKADLFRRAQNGEKATYAGTGGVTVEWYNHAQPISKEHKNEYIMARYKRGEDLWAYTDPVLWSHWGETGVDGDGVEYIFLVTKHALTESELSSSILKKEAMNEFQLALFGLDDFYPGTGWFNPSNVNKSKIAIENAGLEISDSEFTERWNNCFGFCEQKSWSDNPIGTSPVNPYEYVSSRRTNTDENDNKIFSDFSDPVLWGNYSFPSRTFIIYCNTGYDETPTAPEVGQGWWNVEEDTLILDKEACELPSGWSDTNESEDNKITWMCSGVFDHTGKNVSWSNPIRITGKEGKQGADGASIEFIYALTDTPTYPSTPADKKTLFDDVESLGSKVWSSTTWTDRAQAISKEHPIEYIWSRRKSQNSDWEYDAEPVIWSHWGEDGTDGDGIEYIFVTTQTNSSTGLRLPVYSELSSSAKKLFQIDEFVPSSNWFVPKNEPKAREVLGNAFDSQQWANSYGFTNYSTWTDNPVSVDVNNPYQWVSIRKSHYDENLGKSVWDDFGTPSLWSNYSKTSRTVIIYCNMPNTSTPNKPVNGTGTWNVNNNTLDLSGVVDALTGVTTEQRNNHIGVWSDTNVDVSNTISWLVSGIFIENGNNISWSEPFRITGDKGKPGADGSNIEFVYALSDNTPVYPTGSDGDKNTFFESVENAGNAGYLYNNQTRWYDNPQGIANEDGKRTEWVWSRSKAAGENVNWTYTSAPVKWSHWGEDGTDGDGVEYIFITKSQNTYNGSDTSSWNATWNFTNITSRYIYSMDDFVPNSSWFNNTNKQAVIDKMTADGKTFNETHWTAMSNTMDLGWFDNPQALSTVAKYQYVSIRKSSNGTWGKFSYPKLWSRYNITQFQAFAFTATTLFDDISGYTPLGIVSIGDPRPSETKDGNNETVSVTWTDNPTVASNKPQIWMTSATIKEDNLASVEWSSPKKMTDTAEFQVEWCSTDISGSSLSDKITALANDTYNFGTYLANNNYNINAAETAWRNAVRSALGLTFTNSPDNAVLMATCQYANGTWSNWTLARVKGEKGDDGTSLNITGRIVHELSLPNNTYTYSTVSEYFSQHQPTAQGSDELCIVYPKDLTNDIYYGDSTSGKGGALYIWKYNGSSWVDYNSSSNNESTGNTYTTPSGHLILWDGDSWQDMGGIVGEDGKTYIILSKYANDTQDGTGKVFVSDENIASAKWIGILTYEYGAERPEDILVNDPRWKWSLFKGQDGFGYEYIFKVTNTKSAPGVPSTTDAQDHQMDVEPSGWDDEPIEPTSSNKYVWMCWRKYDNSQGKWSKFMGNNGVAKLWNVYNNSIESVTEYFHADANLTPSDTTKFNGNPASYPSYWYTSSDKSVNGWGTSLPYLFNVEVISYSSSGTNKLQPHLVATWETGIKDITDYYCLDNVGTNAPAMTGSAPIISGSGTEGVDYWTTNAGLTKIDASHKYLWNISKKTYDGGKSDTYTTPIVIGVYNEAVNGEDSIYADLDNEMDSIQIDENGKVLENRLCETVVRMYQGSTLMKIKKCTVSGEPSGTTYERIVGNTSSNYTEGDDLTSAGGADGIRMKLNISSGSTLGEYTKIVLSVIAMDGSTRNVSYTLLGTTYPYIYNIQLSDTAIVKNSNGTLSPSSITIKVVERIGSKTPQIYTGGNAANNGFQLSVQKNGTGSKTVLSGSTYSYSTSGLNAGDRLTFFVDVDTDGNNTYETTLDTETVFVLVQGVEGQKGEAGNGYQYCYVRYDKSEESHYSGSTVAVTQASNTSNPTFTIGGYTVTSTSEPQGADATHPYEYRSERSGYGTSNASTWSKWSTPVTIAKYLDTEDITGTIQSEVSTAVGQVQQNIMSNLSDTISRASYLSQYVNESGVFSGSFSDNTKAGLVSAVVSSSALTGEITSQLNGVITDISGVSTFSDWVDQTTGDLATAKSTLTTMSDYASLKQDVTTLKDNDVSEAFQEFETIASEKFANLESGVANLEYVVDSEGYLLVEEPSSTLCIYVDRFTPSFAESWAEENNMPFYNYLNTIIKDPSNEDYGMNAYYFYGVVDSINNLNDGPYYIWYCEDADLYIVTSIINYEDLYNVSLEGTRNGNSYDLTIHPIIAYLNSDFSVYDENTNHSDDVIVTVKKKKILDKIYIDHRSAITSMASNQSVHPRDVVNNVVSDPDGYGVASYEYVEPIVYNSTTYYLWKSNDIIESPEHNFTYVYLLTTTQNIDDLIRLSAEFDYNNIDTHPIIEYLEDDKSTVYVKSSYPEQLGHALDKTNDFILKVSYTKDNGNLKKRRRALDDDGNPTKNIIDVRDDDKDKLITTVSELSKISQTVSDGIACTSITASVWNEDEGEYVTAGQLFQATSEGSMIMMNANKIGIQSDHFTLNESGVTMQGDLYATDTQGNITAGIIGLDNISNPNDIKFFAGTSSDDLSDLDNAPFKVDEQGHLVTKSGEIGGYYDTNNVYHPGATINKYGLSFGGVHINENGIEITDTDGNKSTLSSDGLQLSGTFVKRTAFLTEGLGDDVLYPVPCTEEEKAAIDAANNAKIKKLQDDYGIYNSASVDDIEEVFTKYDIINTMSCGNVTIPNSPKFIGRVITLATGFPTAGEIYQIIDKSGVSFSYSMGGTDTFKFEEGSNCKFYENGGSSSTLKLSNEAVELIGIGIGKKNAFRGFIVSHRYNITTTNDYGHNLRCLGMFTVSNKSLVSDSYSTFNGLSATIETISGGVKLTTPFKVGSTNKIVALIDSENSSGEFEYSTSLGTTSDNALTVSVYSDNITRKFKIMIFNIGDFVSLNLDTKLPGGIISKQYYINGSYTNIGSYIWWNYNSTTEYTFRINVNSSVTKVTCTLGGSNFTLTYSNTTPSNGYVTGKIKPKSQNSSTGYYNGTIYIKVYSTNQNKADAETTIALKQDYDAPYVPSGGGPS